LGIGGIMDTFLLIILGIIIVFLLLTIILNKKEIKIESIENKTNTIDKEVFDKYIEESRVNYNHLESQYIYSITENNEFKKQLKELKEKYDKEISSKKSEQVRLGSIAENLVPFLKDFKYNPKQCHFLGQPIDYLFIGDSEIVFIEVKTGDSTLSSKQKNIKKMIEEKKVRFETHRLNDNDYIIKEH
jgi:predicted Holliday junction resolvase-like endonuclease